MAMLMLDTSPQYYPYAMAMDIIAKLKSGDDEWDYLLEQVADGRAVIQVVDEDGEFVGYWNT